MFSGGVAGSRVNWKYFAPENNQWRPHAPANAQRSQRAEGGSPHRLRQAQKAQYVPAPQAPPKEQLQQLTYAQRQQYYRPYSAVPSHIKQLIEQNYQPQPPYVDPTSFLYSSSFAVPQQHQQPLALQQHQQQPAPQQHQQQLAPAASEIPRAAYLQPTLRYQSIDQRKTHPRLEYSDRRVERQDKVVYNQDYEQQQQQQQQEPQQTHQVALPIGTMPEPPLPTLYLDRNMPTEIKQLLQYQAQIPYDVIANRIQYRPKSVFVPKPLSDDVKGPYYYRSKVYYMNDDNVDEAEYPQDKPVDEEQRHWPRHAYTYIYNTIYIN